MTVDELFVHIVAPWGKLCFVILGYINKITFIFESNVGI